MWFLIKASVFFAAVLVVLSCFSNRPATDAQGMNALQVSDAFQAATGAYQYVSAICSEKPDVCEKGAETFSALGVRAKEGALVAFDLLDKQFGNQGSDKVADKGVAKAVPAPQAAANAQNAPAVQAPKTQVAQNGPLNVPYAPIILAPDAASPGKPHETAAANDDQILTGTVPVPQKRPFR